MRLPSLDELFSSQKERDDAKLKRIYEIPLEEIDPFPDHPFKVRDDEDMMQLVESIRERGVLTPATVTRKAGDRYEMVSGHRRKHACELAGIEEVPVLIRNLDNDEATILMVDSNLQQRDEIPPTERGRAYQMKLEALKHQGKRQELTSSQVGKKSGWAIEQVADDVGQSRKHSYKYGHNVAAA